MGTVKKKVRVRTKGGKTYMRSMNVRSNAAQSVHVRLHKTENGHNTSNRATKIGAVLGGVAGAAGGAMIGAVFGGGLAHSQRTKAAGYVAGRPYNASANHEEARHHANLDAYHKRVHGTEYQHFRGVQAGTSDAARAMIGNAARDYGGAAVRGAAVFGAAGGLAGSAAGAAAGNLIGRALARRRSKR